MKPITGSIVALVTPMHEDGSVDYDALRRLIDWHVAEGTHASASSARPANRRPSPSRSTARSSASRSSTRAAACRSWPAPAATPRRGDRASRFANKVGADCTLSVVPYYNKPSQEGIYRHFKAIAEAVDIPMVLYNVPGAHGRRHAGRDGAAAGAGARHRRHQGSDRRHRARRRLIRDLPPGFSVYSGDDDTAVALMLLGGHGNVSVTANVAPRAMQALCAAALAGNAREAARLQLQLLSLHTALFVEPSPAPTKWALERLGRCGATVRLPILRSAKRAVPRSTRRCARPASRERGDPRPHARTHVAEPIPRRSRRQRRPPPRIDGDFQSDPFPFLSRRGRACRASPLLAGCSTIEDMLAGDKVDYNRRRPRARRRSKCRPT